MIKSTKTLFTISILLLCSALQAQGSGHGQEKNYIGLTYLQAYYKESAAHFNNSLLGVKFGTNFSENFGAELFAAGAVNQANFYVGSTLISANVRSAYGAHLRARTTPSNGFSGYLKAGFANGVVAASSRFGTGWASGTSLSYGAGVEFDIGKSSFLQLDYGLYYSNANVTVTAPSLTFGFRF